MRTGVGEKAMICLKCTVLILLSVCLAAIVNGTSNEIIKPSFLMNYLSVLFGISLAILAIFFNLIEKYKETIKPDKFNSLFLPIIKDFKEDVISYFFMMIIVVIFSFLNWNPQINIPPISIDIDESVYIFILLLSLWVLWDLLKATITLIEGMLSN